MKLKELLPKKTIDILVQNREQRKAVFNTDLNGVINEKGTIITPITASNEKSFQKKLKPYVLCFVADAVLEDIKEKDLKYYNKLYSNIKVYKGETEIKMEALLRKSKSLRGVNQVLQLYH